MPRDAKLSIFAGPKRSSPTRATMATCAPHKRAATAWLAPLPPKPRLNSRPKMVSPGRGNWSVIRDQIDICAADRRNPRLMFHSNASLPSRYNPLMTSITIKWILCAAVLCVAVPAPAQTNAELKEQVRQTEIAFAKTMADRDPAAFASFLAGETVFMSGGRATRGAQQVAERWKAFFQGSASSFLMGARIRRSPRFRQARHVFGPGARSVRQAYGYVQFGLAARGRRQMEDRPG